MQIPRILLTNDDGIDATGLAVLHDVCAEFAKEIWVVAPERDQSGTSQGITLHRPLFSHSRSERKFAVAGAPTDCVALAIHHLMRDARPDLVIAGINAGANIGDEVNLSGTIGAALSALMFDVPAIAVSQACEQRDQVKWETARAILPRILQDVLKQGWRKETCLSINLPDLPATDVKGYKWTRQSTRNIRGVTVDSQISPRGEAYHWLKIARGAPHPLLDSDANALKQGMAAITVLQSDRSLETALPAVSFLPEEVQTAAEDL